MVSFRRPGIKEFFRTYAITDFAVSKDERRLAISTNLSGRYNVWGLDAESTYPYPLTHEDQPPQAIKFDPQNRYILVGFDHDGDENTQLYLIEPAGGSLTDLCRAEGRRHYFCTLSRDGNRIYYCSDKDNHQFLNGYVRDIESGEEKTLYVGEDAVNTLADVAADESSFIVVKQYANTFNVPYVVDADGTRCLTPDPQVQQSAFDLTYLGRDIVFTTNYGSDTAYLATFSLDTGEFQKLWHLPDIDFTSMAVHEASGTVYVVAMRGVEDRLFAYSLATGKASEIGLPVAVVEGLTVGDSGALYLLGRSDVDPFNLYTLHPGGEWMRMTNNRVLGTPCERLSRAQVLHYRSFDSLEIEALWFPADPETANGYTVVWPHGGPQSAERRMFRAVFQCMCSQGYNVFAPNFRGSTGYGAKVMKMVEGDWGHGPRLDVIEGVEHIIRHGRAARDKLFLLGGSYGGYMTLLLHGRHTEYFQAYVDIFGPSNLITFIASVPGSWQPMMRQWLGDPVADRERLLRDSPITYVDQMTRPMLVIQGANDPRVVKAESDQIVELLQSRGVDVEYLVFDDEGHGFMKKENEMAAYGRALDFFDRHRS